MFGLPSPRKLLTQLSLGASLVAAQLQTINNFGNTYGTLHACGGNGRGYFQKTNTKTLKHDGQGDSQVLVSVVDYVINTYKADPKKVYVTGTSSRCMMTNVLAATYPDRFAAATCYSGVAAGCMARSPGSSPISSDRVCSDRKIIKTGQQWADQVKAMYPGYNGAYPFVDCGS
ncbi:feruloyl esterase B precursor (subclass of the carboxylic acid esterase) [Fusarium agapanthi]|uniref:Feruloyl esterase B (Subclass of the carboxylic acid esterase) n=1 Tax=Fusarium agapanthi TaxID=1803897 RepID=A0A9P5AYP9_9HYPO|nr:feruloyl esterase B precursor (subclass of the carboxylic acid esterase) [Fusarium agapanthi]